MPAARSKKDDHRSDSPPSSDDGLKDLAGLHGVKDDPSKPKRKRQSQSCDACRARKVRCAREDPDDAHQSCKHCVALGIKCTYDYQPKKRGPPNLYLRRLQEAAAAAAAAQQVHNPNSVSPTSGHTPPTPNSLTNGNGIPSPRSIHSHSPVVSTNAPPPLSLTPTSSNTVPSQGPTSNGSRNATTPPAGAGAVPSSSFLEPSLPPSRYPIAADTQGFLQQHGHNHNHNHSQQQQQQQQQHYGVSPTFDHAHVLNGSGASDTWSSPSFASPTVPKTTPPLGIHANLSPHGPSLPYPQSIPSHHHSHSYHLPPVPPPPAHHLPLPLSANVLPHSLNVLAPPTTISHILNLFFCYIYPLTPCIHKPSFLADLASGRHERDPLFFALVCSTVASTLVQVPRSYLHVGLDLGEDGVISDGPGGRRGVRRLAKRAHERSRIITVANYDPPSSTHVVIRYFDTIYHFCEGHDATSHASFGEAAHIAVTLHMHEEASYEGLDPIEREVRKRAFWLLFGADKSMAILLGRPICLRDEDCTLHFPAEVDDEYITLSGILPQPAGKTAIVSGLNYISRIFALLGEILVRIRVDKRSPPMLASGGGSYWVKARLEEVKSLHARICSALVHAPAPLQLNRKINFNGHMGANSMFHDGAPGSDTGSVNGANGASSVGDGPGGNDGFEFEYGGAGFRKAAFAEVKEFFDNPGASRANASNPFLVMQANLYVTQQLVRFVIEQYRDELVTSMRAQMGDAAIVLENDLGRAWTTEDREAVASDLLNVLHSIPIQSIATNGPSLVHKVRFVASTLLDAVRKAETAPASAARAHAYLWDFLSILSEIERNYVLDDDRDGGTHNDSVALG